MLANQWPTLDSFVGNSQRILLSLRKIFTLFKSGKNAFIPT